MPLRILPLRVLALARTVVVALAHLARALGLLLLLFLADSAALLGLPGAAGTLLAHFAGLLLALTLLLLVFPGHIGFPSLRCRTLE